MDAPLADLTWVINAWRTSPHPRLGDLAEILDDQLGSVDPRPAMAPSKKRDFPAVWNELEAAGDPLDFARLMIGARGGSQEDVIRQVNRLVARRDPRLGRGLLSLLETPPYAGVKSRALLSEILVALEDTGDARVPARARELAARYLGVVRSSTGGWVIGKLQDLAQRMADLPIPELSPEQAQRCTIIEAGLAATMAQRQAAATTRQRVGSSVQALLAAVYDTPDEDGPRLVLADALLEAGDLRGELITLQCRRAEGMQTAEQARREREILGDTGRCAVWAHPLSNAGRCTFERGFPARIALYPRGSKSIGDPAWATVTSLDGLAGLSIKAAVDLLRQPLARQIRDVVLNAKILEKLSGTSCPFTRCVVFDATDLRSGLFRTTPHLLELELDTRAWLPSNYGYRMEREFPSETSPWPADLFGELHELQSLTLRTGAALAADLVAPLHSLRRLDIVARNQAQLPALPSSLQSLALALGGGELAPGAFGTLSILRRLALDSRWSEPPPPGLFDGLDALEELQLTQHLPAPVFRGLRGVTKLALARATGDAPNILSWFPLLEELTLFGCELADLTAAPSLRTARVTAPDFAGHVLREFVDRHPRLEYIELEIVESVKHPHDVRYGPHHAERECLAALAGSSLTSVMVTGSHHYSGPRNYASVGPTGWSEIRP